VLGRVRFWFEQPLPFVMFHVIKLAREGGGKVDTFLAVDGKRVQQVVYPPTHVVREMSVCLVVAVAYLPKVAECLGSLVSCV